MIGRTIGRYEVLARLGAGGMGTVWKARHTLLPDRIVALKLLAESLWSSEEARQRFLREAIAVSRLDTHRGIAALFEAEYIDGRLCIAFQFIDGDTVAAKTAAGPLPLAEAVAIAADAAEALAHAHARGVLHRDLSAGNLMVDRQGRGVLVDFGLARSVADPTLTEPGTTQGTLRYMAPELWRGEPADARSDLYALGVVLYRMVTGREPFQADSVAALEYQVQHEAPAPPSALRPEVPPELDDVVLRLLEKRRGDRPASAEGLAAELRRLKRRPGLAPGGTLEVPGRGWGWRRRLDAVRRRARSRAGRWVLAGGMALALLATAATIARQRGWWPPFAAPRYERVAVLPARNLSADVEETAHLAEGLGEELASRLGEIPGFRIIPWITTHRFRDATQALSKVARELRADALVVGSYRSDGERIRVTVSLVDGRSGDQRWSQSWEEGVDDLFALQKNVALGVASQLKRRLTGEERERLGSPASTSSEAYDHFIRGATYFHDYDPQSLVAAELFFRKALELDPHLAEAWVGLGAIQTDRYFRGDLGLAGLGEAERCFGRALEIRPGLPTALRGMVRVHFHQGAYERALQVGAVAARARPDDIEAQMVRGWAYALGGLPEKAVPVLTRVIELDPANQGAAWYRVFATSWAGQHDRAIDYARDYLRRFPEDGEVYTWLGVSLAAAGRLEEARLSVERAMDLLGEDASNVYVVMFAAAIYRKLGQRERRESLVTRWIQILEARLSTHPDNTQVRPWLASLYALAGRRTDFELALDREIADEARRGDRSAADWGFAAVFLALLGNHDRAAELCRLSLKADLASGVVWRRQFQDVWVNLLELQALFDLPEFRALLEAIDRRQAELAARY